MPGPRGAWASRQPVLARLSIQGLPTYGAHAASSGLRPRGHRPAVPVPLLGAMRMSSVPGLVAGQAPSAAAPQAAGLPGLPASANLELLTLPRCHEVIDQLTAEVNLLRQQVAFQNEKLVVLEERLKLDSKNSSKPPSSDGPASGKRAKRPASKRKRGAQAGHEGKHRALLDEAQVDKVIDCQPVEVCECGGAVAAGAEAPIRHQVFDVPPVQPQVHEYRRYSGRCTGCGKAHRGALPAGVPSGQIGPKALALIGALGTHYHLTQFKIRDLLAQMMGVDFSVGAISQAHGKVAQALKAPVAALADFVVQAPVKLMDETRYPREGAGNWAWVVVTPKAVWYSLLPSRARYVATSLVGEKFTGILVSDRYAVYDYVGTDQRQVCWSHYLESGLILGTESFGWRVRRGRNLSELKIILSRAAKIFGPTGCRHADSPTHRIEPRGLRHRPGVASCAPRTMSVTSSGRVFIYPQWQLPARGAGCNTHSTVVLPRRPPDVQPSA